MPKPSLSYEDKVYSVACLGITGKALHQDEDCGKVLWFCFKITSPSLAVGWVFNDTPQQTKVVILDIFKLLSMKSRINIEMERQAVLRITACCVYLQVLIEIKMDRKGKYSIMIIISITDNG